jgi:hypothetical protein
MQIGTYALIINAKSLRSPIMSQITIVDDVLNFTEVNPVMHRAAAPSDGDDNTTRERHNDEAGAKSLNEEEQRVVHELTSILISGHLPQ